MKPLDMLGTGSTPMSKTCCLSELCPGDVYYHDESYGERKLLIYRTPRRYGYLVVDRYSAIPRMVEYNIKGNIAVYIKVAP